MACCNYSSSTEKIPTVGTIITPILQTRQLGHTVVSNLRGLPSLPLSLPEGRSHAPRALAPPPLSTRTTLLPGRLGFLQGGASLWKSGDFHGQWFRNRSSQAGGPGCLENRSGVLRCWGPHAGG